MQLTSLLIPLATCAAVVTAVDRPMSFYNTGSCDTSQGGTEQTIDVPVDDTCVSLGQPGALSYDPDAIDIDCTVFGDQNCQTQCVGQGKEVGLSTCIDLSNDCVAASIRCLQQTSCC